MNGLSNLSWNYKDASDQCNGIGVYHPLAPNTALYNCSGTFETLDSMRNSTEKAFLTSPCSSCTPGNASCTSTCCPVVSTDASYYCSCPIDFQGVDCTRRRPFTCTLIPPTPPASLSYTQATSNPVILLYRLSCQFLYPLPNINLTTYPASSATLTEDVAGPEGITSYARLNNEIAFTSLDTESGRVIPMVFNLVHLYALSRSVSISVDLSCTQILGLSDIQLDLDLGPFIHTKFFTSVNHVPVNKSAFLVGGRVYYEASVPKLYLPGLQRSKPQFNGFLDITDLPDEVFATVQSSGILRTNQSESLLTSIVVLIGIGIMSVLAIGYLIRKSVQRRPEN